MSFVNANLPIQKFVNDWGNTGRTYAALNYFPAVSNANTTIEINPSTFLVEAGKKRTLKINYWPILCDVDGTCDADICGTGEVAEPKQVYFDITRCTASKIYRIAKDNVRLTDSGAWDFSGIAKAIVNSILPTLRRNLAVDMTTYGYDLAGLHLDGLATHRITVTNPANGIVNPIGRFDINREFMDGGFNEPYLYGGQEVYNWQAMVAIGGLNFSGQNINQLSTSNSWYDDGLSDEILNDLANGGHILAIAPEVFKWVYYLDNAGIFRTDGIPATLDGIQGLFRSGMEAVLNGTIIDPVTRIPWDLDIYHSPCGKWVNFRLQLHWDFFVIPDIACNAMGVNGIMHYRTCPPVIAVCPTGDTPPSPATATTYNWTPTMSELETISQSTIGEFSVNQNSPVAIANIAALVAYMNANSTGITFTAVGGQVRYSGFYAIGATFNNAAVTATFA